MIDREQDVARLKGRAKKFVDYCLDKKGKRKTKAASLAEMIHLERAKAYDQALRDVGIVQVPKPKRKHWWQRLTS